MHRDETGLIWPDITKCIGCGYCTMACPYHAPVIDKELKRSSKCDGCREASGRGQAPICVEACPLRALDFGRRATSSSAMPNGGTRCAATSFLCLRKRRPGPIYSSGPAPLLPKGRKGALVNRKEIGL